MGYQCSHHYYNDSLFTTSPPITLDELSHVGSIIPDPVRYISKSSYSLKKKHIFFQKLWNEWLSLLIWQIGMKKIHRPNEFLQTVLEGSKLKDLVNLEVAMHISSLSFWRGEQEDYQWYKRTANKSSKPTRQDVNNWNKKVLIIEVIEKVFMCLMWLKKNFQKHMDLKHLNKYEKVFKVQQYLK